MTAARKLRATPWLLPWRPWWRALCFECLQRIELLTDWEIEFCASLARQDRAQPDQLGILCCELVVRVRAASGADPAARAGLRPL